MRTFWTYLTAGLKRPHPADRLGPSSGKRPADRFRNLLPFLKGRWSRASLGGFLVLSGVLVSLPVPLIFRFLVDRVILGRQLRLLAIGVLLLVLAKALGFVVNTWQPFFFARFEQEIITDIQGELLDRTLKMPKSFFDEKETGYLMSRLQSDVGALRWFFSANVPQISASILKLAGGLALLGVLNWKLALATLAALPLLAATVRFFSRSLRRLGHHGMERQAEVSRLLEESLASSTLVKSFAVENRQQSKVRSRLRSLLQVNLEQTAVSTTAGLAIGLIPDAVQLLVLVTGAMMVISGQWTLGSLLAFQTSLQYVFSPAQFLAGANLQLQQAMAALERVSTLFEIVPEENLESGIAATRLGGKIEFDRVSFSYDGREPILRNISFTVHPGEHVAIVGSSGVGKTTLLSLILQLYRPTSGAILLDDRSVREYRLTSLRRRIGYVAQHVQLVSGTVLENILYGEDTASEEDARKAATAAGIASFLDSLPLGYRTPLGEGGMNLSEGQRQRLALARALVKNPDILILDEPTAALDPQAERSIFEALPEQIAQKTLILVAHRQATIQRMNRVLLLDGGQIRADGSAAEIEALLPLSP